MHRDDCLHRLGEGRLPVAHLWSRLRQAVVVEGCLYGHRDRELGGQLECGWVMGTFPMPYADFAQFRIGELQALNR